MQKMEPCKIFVKNEESKPIHVTIGAKSDDSMRKVIWFEGILMAGQTAEMSGPAFEIAWKDEEEKGQRLHESAAHGKDKKRQ